MTAMPPETHKTAIDVVGGMTWVPTFVSSMRQKGISSTRRSHIAGLDFPYCKAGLKAVTVFVMVEP
jgi:hypothetical protein